MKSLKLFVLTLIFGLFTVAGMAQERQHERGHQHQEKDVEITDLPRQVQETLRDDYEGWKATSAKVTSDTEEQEQGSFYKVTMNKTDNGERKTKIVKIAMDGEVIDEEEVDEEQQRMQKDKQRDRQYTPAAQQQERGHMPERGHQERGQQHMQERGHQDMQERDVEITDLPRQIQETLRNDFKDWKATSAQVTSDTEEHEQGSFYKVTMNKTDNGERKTKIVSLAMDGEVIDEEEADEDYMRKQQDKQRDRQHTPADRQQERGQQDYGQQERGEQQREIQVTDLPMQVQETLRDDYEDWKAVEVQIATDREAYEEGSFYKVKMNKTNNGEQETKIVMIARDGEVIDEEEVDEDNEREKEKRRRDRQR